MECNDPKPEESRDFARELSRRVTFLQRSRRRFMGERLRSRGVSGSAYTILLHVDRFPGASQDSVAAHMYIDKCNVTRRAKRLEELGYLRRETDPQDRRQNNLYLTPEGEALVPFIRECLSEWGEKVTAPLSDGERKMLILLLEKLAEF